MKKEIILKPYKANHAKNFLLEINDCNENLNKIYSIIKDKEEKIHKTKLLGAILVKDKNVIYCLVEFESKIKIYSDTHFDYVPGKVFYSTVKKKKQSILSLFHNYEKLTTFGIFKVDRIEDLFKKKDVTNMLKSNLLFFPHNQIKFNNKIANFMSILASLMLGTSIYYLI